MQFLRNIFLPVALCLPTISPTNAQEETNNRQESVVRFINDQDFKDFCNVPDRKEFVIKRGTDPSLKPFNIYACNLSQVMDANCRDLDDVIQAVPAMRAQLEAKGLQETEEQRSETNIMLKTYQDAFDKFCPKPTI